MATKEPECKTTEEPKGNDKDTGNEKAIEHFVGTIHEFDRKGRMCVEVMQSNGKKRPIAIFRIKNRYFALDSRCYHAGGPLEMGDIEEMGTGNFIVKCPWHRYIITLDKGEGLYMAYDPIKKQHTGVKSKGIKQRPHKVRYDNSNGKLYVTLNIDKKEYPSDHYVKDQDETPPPINFKFA